MKLINNISVLLLAVVFLLSATGIVVFQSHCSCTGNDNVSLYVSPDTCEDNFHSHHTHLPDGEEVPATAGECHECTTHTQDCGCNTLIINYLKLKNEVVFEKVRSKTFMPITALPPDVSISLLSDDSDFYGDKGNFYIEPPVIQSSLDFLIDIQQLKIPSAA